MLPFTMNNVILYDVKLLPSIYIRILKKIISYCYNYLHIIKNAWYQSDLDVDLKSHMETTNLYFLSNFLRHPNFSLNAKPNERTHIMLTYNTHVERKSFFRLQNLNSNPTPSPPSGQFYQHEYEQFLWEMYNFVSIYLSLC